MRLFAVLVFASLGFHAMGQPVLPVVPATMKDRLAKDSIARNNAYYYRINKVQQVVVKGHNSKKTEDINWFGATTLEVHYLDGKKFFSYEMEYDVYGNLSKMMARYYDLSENERTTYQYGYEYKVAPDGLTEILVKSTSETTRYGENEDVTTSGYTLYTYDDHNRLIREVTEGSEWVCSDTIVAFTTVITYAYNRKGNVTSMVTTQKGGCNDGEVETENYEYDRHNRVVKSTVIVNGDTDAVCSTSWSRSGRRISYTKTNKDGSIHYKNVTTYKDNGLIADRVITLRRKSETEYYTYSFYQ